MSNNYANYLPKGRDNVERQECPPPILAKAVFSSENASASSVISVSHDTTEIEIAAVSAPAVMKWIATTNTGASVVSAASGANYDHVIATGTVRRFVIPRETGGSSMASVQGVNRAEGLYQRVAYKSIGVASILYAEY